MKSLLHYVEYLCFWTCGLDKCSKYALCLVVKLGSMRCCCDNTNVIWLLTY